MSNTVNVNTSAIEKNTTAINTEKLARQNAIEQEQTARTQQDNVLDSKITSLDNDKLGEPYFLDNINDNGTYTFNSITLIDTHNLPSGVTTFSIHLYGALKYLAIKFLSGRAVDFSVLTLSSPGELVEFNMKESTSSSVTYYKYLLLIPFYDE